jgi:hypothetical protein
LSASDHISLPSTDYEQLSMKGVDINTIVVTGSITTSSATSLTIGSGIQSLIVAATGLTVTVGQQVIITHDSNNAMTGTVGSYNPSILHL